MQLETIGLRLLFLCKQDKKRGAVLYKKMIALALQSVLYFKVLNRQSGGERYSQQERSACVRRRYCLEEEQ